MAAARSCGFKKSILWETRSAARFFVIISLPHSPQNLFFVKHAVIKLEENNKEKTVERPYRQRGQYLTPTASELSSQRSSASMYLVIDFGLRRLANGEILVRASIFVVRCGKGICLLCCVGNGIVPRWSFWRVEGHSPFNQTLFWQDYTPTRQKTP